MSTSFIQSIQRVLPRSRISRYAIFIFCVSAALRFTALNHPSQVVFDEVHFGKFTSAYCCTHKRFFDIHPPLAKLTVAGVLSLTDYDGTKAFEKIGEPYGSVSPLAFRIVPAVFGTAVPVLIFFLLLLLGATPVAALLGGLLIGLDNGFIVQSRVLALDTQLIFFELSAVTFMLLALRRCTRIRRSVWFSLSGVCAALAVGSKLTGLIAVSIPLLIWFVTSLKDFWQGRRLQLQGVLWFLGAGILTYLAIWKIHFFLLDQPGYGDRYYELTGNFLKDLFAFHYVMYERNASLTKTHSYASMWFTWPWMRRGIFYWGGEGRYVYFLGNPVIWIGSFLAGFSMFAVWLLQRCSNLRLPDAEALRRPLIWIPILAYFNAFVPYVLVRRDLFLYHYLPPLSFLVIALMLWFDRIGLTRKGGLKEQRRAVLVIVLLGVAGWLCLAPITYAWPVQAYTKWLLAAIPTWR